jgi:hypothetical protein
MPLLSSFFKTEANPTLNPYFSSLLLYLYFSWHATSCPRGRGATLLQNKNKQTNKQTKNDKD